MMVLRAAIVAVLLMIMEPVTAARTYTSGWVKGRATFFGRDAWSLHDGSCGFGFVCPNRWTNQGLRQGYDLVAISDQSPLFHGYSGAQCGQCLEVKCRSAVMHDRYGARIQRLKQCRDESASVKVKITDTCDCKYGPNAASNARWCCGDKPHLDMSQWALDKLVYKSSKFGVFAIKYRTISCNAHISNEAKSIPIVKDPHSGMRGKTNCGAQGGYSTQSRKKSRAFVKKRKSRHSPKYWYRQQLMSEAGNRRSSRKFRKRLNTYLKQFNNGMKYVRKWGVKNPT